MYLQRKQYLLQWQSKKLKPFNGNEEGEHGIETAMTTVGALRSCAFALWVGKLR